MRITITLDDDLLAQATKLAGALDRSALISFALRAFIERESGRRLALLGGTQVRLTSVPRRREKAAR